MAGVSSESLTTALVALEAKLPFASLQLAKELFGILVDMQNDVGTAFGAVAGRDLEFGTSVADPACRFGSVLVGQRLDLHLVGHLELGIKSETELTVQFVGVPGILELLDELGRS